MLTDVEYACFPPAGSLSVILGESILPTAVYITFPKSSPFILFYWGEGATTLALKLWISASASP